MGRKVALVMTAMAALAMASVSVSAQAQTRSRTESPVAGNLTDQGARGARRALQWNAEGRWGLNLEVQQPVGREADWNDVEAGAYFRVSPSVRVGGSVDLGESRADPARPAQDPRGQPRVRLETTFRF